MDIKEFVHEKMIVAEQSAKENETGLDSEMAKIILTCIEDAEENDRFSVRERKLVSNIYISVHRGKKFRKVNQAESAFCLIEKAKRLGFDKWFDIMKKEKAEQANNEQANN